MTVVNTVTGEIVDFDSASAERRAQQIETRLTAVGESFTIAMQKIREAIELRDDIALGYRSPGDYVSARFGRALSGLPVEMRREAVRELTEAGMSTRAIAPVVGVHHDTVARDARRVVDTTPEPQTPAPSALDAARSGQTSKPDLSPGSDDVDAPTSAMPQGEDAPEGSAPGLEPSTATGVPASATPRPAVTGIDGKNYKRPESKPRTSPRKPLPDAFRDRLYDVNAKAESLHRLIADDRWATNAKKLATVKNRNELLRTRDLLEQVINALPTEEVTA